MLTAMKPSNAMLASMLLYASKRGRNATTTHVVIRLTAMIARKRLDPGSGRSRIIPVIRATAHG